MMTKDEVRAAIRFGNPPRPPRAFTKWWGEGLWEQYGNALSRFQRFQRNGDHILSGDAYQFVHPVFLSVTGSS